LEKGRPLIALIPKPPDIHGLRIVLQGMPLDGFIERFTREKSHWVIVIGFNSSQFILHDPASGRICVMHSTFGEWWARKGNTCLLVSVP
jgi:hypothetical protein